MSAHCIQVLEHHREPMTMYDSMIMYVNEQISKRPAILAPGFSVSRRKKQLCFDQLQDYQFLALPSPKSQATRTLLLQCCSCPVLSGLPSISILAVTKWSQCPVLGQDEILSLFSSPSEALPPIYLKPTLTVCLAVTST